MRYGALDAVSLAALEAAFRSDQTRNVDTPSPPAQPTMGGVGGSLYQDFRPEDGTTGSGRGSDWPGAGTPPIADRGRQASAGSIVYSDVGTPTPPLMEARTGDLFRPVQLDEHRALAGYSGNPGSSWDRVKHAVPNVIMLVMVCASSFHMALSWMTDIRPPMILHKLESLTPIVRQCGGVLYRAKYDKRAECSPPDGSGEVHYRFAQVTATPNPDGAIIRENVAGIRGAVWKPGINMDGEGAANVPCDLPPGDYSITTISIYLCARAPYPLQTASQPMLVKVLPRE